MGRAETVVEVGEGESSAHAERVAAGGADTLLDCLLVVARAHGRALTPDAVLAGLPLVLVNRADAQAPKP